ncbi:MAG: hypothetical protein IJ272_01885 [Clostridia bacterium]|nr:hypothetical protein [Clostridia bacterium]
MARKKVETVEMLPINIQRVVLKVVGDTPLIVHNFNEKTKRQMLEKQMKKAETPREAKNPIEDFMRSLHWLTEMPEEFTEEAFVKAIEEGAKFGFPSIGLKASAVSGAYRSKLAKDKVSLNGAFHIDAEYIVIDGTPEIREDMVRVANGMPDIRYRAEFKEWSALVEIKYNSAIFSLEQIVNFLNVGGFSVGIGEWRAEKGGSYGSFHIESAE